MRIQRRFAFQPCWSCFLDYFCRVRRNTHENLFGKVKGVAPGKSYPPPRASNMIVPRKRRASRSNLTTGTRALNILKNLLASAITSDVGLRLLAPLRSRCLTVLSGMIFVDAHHQRIINVWQRFRSKLNVDDVPKYLDNFPRGSHFFVIPLVLVL